MGYFGTMSAVRCFRKVHFWVFLDLRVRVELLFCPEVFLLRGVVVSTGRDFCPEGFYPARVLSGVLSDLGKMLGVRRFV